MTTITQNNQAAIEAARRAAEEAARRAAEAEAARQAARAAQQQAERAQQNGASAQKIDRFDNRAGRLLETAEQRTEAAVRSADRASVAVERARGKVDPFGTESNLLTDGFETPERQNPALKKLDRIGARVDGLATRERSADVRLDGQRAQRTDLSPEAKKDLRLDAEARLRSSPAYSNLSDEGSRVDLAAAIAEEAKRLPPDQATQLVQSFQPQLEEIAKSANGTPSEDVRRGVIDSFSEIAEEAGPNGARVLAESFANVAIDDHTDVNNTDQLGGALKASITGGHGAAFAAALTQELRETHPGTDLAQNVEKATREGIRDVREAFDEGTAKFQNLDAGLRATLEVLGPDATKDEIEAQTQAFIDENQGAYDDFEEQSAQLMTVMDGAAMLANDASLPDDLRSESTEALTRLEIAGNSQAGKDKLSEAVGESQYRDTMGNSFLDDVSEAGATGNVAAAGAGLADKLAQTRVIAAGQVTKTLGNEAVLAGLAGDSARADDLMGQLKNMHELYGLSPEKQAEVIDGINEIMGQRLSPDETAQKLDELVGVKGSAASASDYGLTALRGLGIVAGLPGVISADYGSDDLATRAKAYAGAVGFGADALAMTNDLLAAGGKYPGLGAALGKLTTVTGLVTGGIDGVQGIQKVLDGNISEGGPQVLTGVGGVTMSAATLFAGAAASQAVPVAGQIAGAALVLAGVAWTAINGANGEADAEQSWQSLYEGLGVSEETAEALAEADDNDGRSVMPFLLDLRDSLGTDKQEFADWVQGMDENTATFLVNLSKDMPRGEIGDAQLDVLRTIGAVPGGELETYGTALRPVGDAEYAQELADDDDDLVAIGSLVFDRSEYELQQNLAESYE